MISKGLVNKTWLHRFFGKINGNKFDISKLDHTLQSWESAQLNKILSKHTKTQKTTEERVEEMDSAQFKGMEDFFNSSKGNKMYEDMMQDEMDKESVLRSWKKEDMDVDKMWNPDNENEVKDYVKKFERLQEKTSNYFRNAKTGSDLANRSRYPLNLTITKKKKDRSSIQMPTICRGVRTKSSTSITKTTTATAPTVRITCVSRKTSMMTCT